MRIAVAGGHECTPEEAALARRAGELLAEARAVVLCGGYGGVMAAVAEGARSAGGLVVGLLAGDSLAGAAPDLTVALPTGLGEMRNALLVRAGDALLAIGGGFGTLSEIALAVRTGKPVVGLATWEFRDPHGGPDPVLRASGVEEAVAAVLRLAAAVRGPATPPGA
ncbi:MAG: LOG family protein [Bacillota bacterium]|nr:LOG family protein [Bacillota bacterium]